MNNERVISKNAKVNVLLQAIEHNLNIIKRQLPAAHPVMAVVKADAYGHGAVEVARFLDDKVAWFAVNSVEEGIALRKKKIQRPILVFGVPEPYNALCFKQYNLTATVSSTDDLDILPDETSFHLNIDTGMGRLGVSADDLPMMLEKINQSKAKCTGAYSHFATSDHPGSEKVKRQFSKFEKLQNEIPERWIIHLSNTGGVFNYPEAKFNMVRSGIALYGYSPGSSDIEGLQPALKFQTRLVHVKKLEKGDAVSYGATWQADTATHIGVIPVGYMDGIPRILSGKMQVKIKGHLYPVVGTITMNYCMINLGENNIQTGTPVHLIDGQDLTAKHWADATGTIPYEILTGLARTVLRQYED